MRYIFFYHLGKLWIFDLRENPFSWVAEKSLGQKAKMKLPAVLTLWMPNDASDRFFHEISAEYTLQYIIEHFSISTTSIMYLTCELVFLATSLIHIRKKRAVFSWNRPQDSRYKIDFLSQSGTESERTSCKGSGYWNFKSSHKIMGGRLKKM